MGGVLSRITRTAASTDEQVICSSRCRVLGIYPELLTTGVVRLRNAGSAVMVFAPANPVATGHATGGTLADATYYAKVVSVDANGEFSLPSTEVNSGALAGGGINSVGLAWDADPRAVSYRVFFGTASGVLPKYFAASTNSFTLTTTTGQLTATIPAASTSGDTGLAHKCAIGMAQVGKDFGGAVFESGLTFQGSVSTDRCAVIWEAK